MKTPDGFVPVIKKSLIVALFAVACMVAGEILIRKAPNPYSIKHHYMMNHGKDVETLLLGSSHIFFGVDPDGFDRPAFNLANVSQSVRVNYELLKHYDGILTGGKLKRILMNIDGGALFDPELQDGDEWYYLTGYCMYMDLPGYDSPRHHFEIANPTLYKHRLLAVLKGKSSTLAYADSLGFIACILPGDSMKVAESGAITALNHCIGSINQVNTNILYVDSVALWCHERNIELILLKTPKYKTYTEAYPRKYAHVVDSAIREFHSRFPEVRMLDFSTDPRFGIGDYYDGNHLCHRGAEKFTKILADTLHI